MNEEADDHPHRSSDEDLLPKFEKSETLAPQFKKPVFGGIRDNENCHNFKNTVIESVLQDKIEHTNMVKNVDTDFLMRDSDDNFSSLLNCIDKRPVSVVSPSPVMSCNLHVFANLKCLSLL